MRHAPHPFTLRQLQYIAAVAEHGSFRRAAEVCRVAQPSLSEQIAVLESALGFELFLRNSRQIRLTQAGRAFLDRVSMLLNQSDALVDYARSLCEPEKGVLKIGVIPTVAPYLLPELATILKKRFSNLTVVWYEDKTAVLREKSKNGELDAVIIAAESGLEGMTHVELGTDPFVFVAPRTHPLAKSRRSIALRELEGESLLLLDDGHCFRDQVLAACANAGAEESNYRATSLVTLVQMVASGLGVTLLPKLALATENRQGKLKTRNLLPSSFRTLVFSWEASSALGQILTQIGALFRDKYESYAVREKD
jgi:LysR family hydrogen peroxide-inducible transcriptional activator